MADDRDPDQREPLAFDTDRGASRSKWLAIGFTLLLVAWLGSGFIWPSGEDEGAAPAPAASEPMTVAVRESTAQPVQQTFVAEGQAEPDRDTTMRAGVSGEIAEVPVEKGDEVAEGDLIAQFELAGRKADLARAREALDRAERNFQNAKTLLEQGAGTQDRVTETRSARAAAQADLAAAEQAIEDTAVRAPFAGRVEALAVDAGEYVSAGGEIARITDIAPLTVVVQVPQQTVESIEEGERAHVSFITGVEREGTVTFVGQSADPATRTFSVEIEVANEGGEVPSGISAEVRIPTGKARGHFLSPAILSLGTDGTLGVKTVTDDDTVVFHEVSVIRAQTDGVWVSGLPETARIITVGQGFVNAGDTVAPRPAESVGRTASAAPPPAVAP